MKWFFVFYLLVFNSYVLLFGQGLFESALTKTDSSHSFSESYMHGFVRGAVYSGLNMNDKPYFQSLYGEFGLIADVSGGSFGNAFAEARFRTGNEFSNDFEEVYIREAYVNLYAGPLQIRAGKQILTEGVAGIINPTDLYAPANPVSRSPYSTDLRLGIWALSTKLIIPGSSSFELKWLPLYRPSELMIDAFEFPVNVNLKKYNGGELLFRKTGIHGKYALHSTYFDMDLSFFHGYRNTPGIASDTIILDAETLTPETVQLKPEAYLINSPGINFSIPLGDLIFRGECAWIELNDDINGIFSEISYAAEIEKSGSLVSLTGGYYGKYIFDFDVPEGDPFLFTSKFPDLTEILPAAGNFQAIQLVDQYFKNQVDFFNRIYNYQAEEYYHSIYATLHMKMFNELLEMSLPAMYNFTNQEFMIIPSMDFLISDQLNINMGGYFLKGKIPSLYQLAGPALNAFYVMLQLKF